MKLVLAFTLMISISSGIYEDNSILGSSDISWMGLGQWISNFISYIKNKCFGSCKVSDNRSSVISSDCECGATKEARARVIGGKETGPNQYPWIVLVYTSHSRCGGSVISNYHVLTAAHCTEGVKANELRIHVGLHNIQNELDGKVYNVISIIQHKNYDSEVNARNDISVLVSEKEINFDENVSPVCLPKKSFYPVLEELKIIGWGDTKGTGDGNVLREIDVRSFPLSECGKIYPGISYEDTTRICLIGKKKTSCQGDSGSSVVYLNPAINRYTQLAVVSAGHINCNTSYPTVHTMVFAFMDWIAEAVSSSKQGVNVCTGNKAA